MSRIPLTLLVLTTVAASPAAGDMQVQLFNSYFGSVAGEFDVDSVGTTPIPFATSVTNNGHDFITFCLEIYAPVGFGTTFDVILNDSTVGDVMDGAPDALNPSTAYLFSQFARGDLFGYATSGSARRSSADELQEAIWYIEGQWDTLDGWAALWVGQATSAVNAGGSWYNEWGPDSIGNVRVMNLYQEGHAGDAQYNIQDQLVLVPVPGSALIAVLGLGIIGFLRHRFR